MHKKCKKKRERAIKKKENGLHLPETDHRVIVCQEIAEGGAKAWNGIGDRNIQKIGNVMCGYVPHCHL